MTGQYELHAAEQPPNLTGPGVVSFYPYGMTESWLPVVGHPADNRLENIEWATRSVNMLDRVRHGTHPQARRTACPQGHPYSGVNANGKRICRTCASKQRQAWLDKRKMVMA